MSNDLEFLALRQSRISRMLKALEARKKELRDQFFKFADEFVKDNTHLLPTISIRVPLNFFKVTGMTHDEFIKTRYPHWSVTAISESDDNMIFVLRKRPEFMPYSSVAGEFEISRSVSELTPKVDWETMEQADPDLFTAFAKPIQTYELDTEAFQRFMAENPGFDAQGFLARHSIHKEPTLRVLTKAVKPDE